MNWFSKKILLFSGLVFLSASFFLLSPKPVFAVGETCQCTVEGLCDPAQVFTAAMGVTPGAAQCSSNCAAAESGTGKKDIAYLFLDPKIIDSTCKTLAEKNTPPDPAIACVNAAQKAFDDLAVQTSADADALIKAKITCMGGTLPAAPTPPAQTPTVPLYNPLGTKVIGDVLGRIIKYLIGLAGSVALLMFVWGGFQFLWSGGDANKVKKGKDTLINAALGIVILLSAFTIISKIITTLTSGT